MSLLTYLLTYADNAVASQESWTSCSQLVGLECREENRPFSGQQHQAQFGLNPALHLSQNLCSVYENFTTLFVRQVACMTNLRRRQKMS